MPIKVTCQCGKSFAAKDELAGKAVKCPNCQQPLRIPAAGIAAPLPSAAQSAPAMQQAAAPAPAMGGSSLFDEVGLKAAPAGSIHCPGCALPLPQNAVLCIKCGYNLKLARRMETVKLGEGASAGGHGAPVGDLMGRAAMSIEEDKEAERSKTKEGLPWWAYLIGLILVSGFVILMMIIPQNQAIMAAGGLMIMIGSLTCLYAYIRTVIVAFTENVGFGLLVLFLGGCGFLIFTIIRWEKCGTYFLMWLGGGVIQAIGVGAIILGQSIPPPQDVPVGAVRIPYEEQHMAIRSDAEYRSTMDRLHFRRDT